MVVATVLEEGKKLIQVESAWLWALDFGPIDELRKHGDLAAIGRCRELTLPNRNR